MSFSDQIPNNQLICFKSEEAYFFNQSYPCYSNYTDITTNALKTVALMFFGGVIALQCLKYCRRDHSKWSKLSYLEKSNLIIKDLFIVAFAIFSVSRMATHYDKQGALNSCLKINNLTQPL